MDCSTPGFPVLHHLLERAQIYVHWVGDDIQPSCSLSIPSPPAFTFLQNHSSKESILCDCMDCSTAQASLSFTLSWSAPQLMSIHWVGDPVQPSDPLSPISLPALNASFLASGSFPMSRPFAAGGQSIGASLGVYFLRVASLFTHSYRSRSSFFKNLPLETYKK